MMPRLLIALLAGLLSACATTSAPGPHSAVSPIQREADDFNITVAQGAIAGAIVGGLAGALLSGGDPRRIVTGAVAGGAVGLAGGFYVAGQKQTYARREDALDALVTDTRQRNDKLTRLLATTNQVVAKRRAELGELKTATAAAQTRVQRQRALLAELEADSRALDQSITSANEHARQIEANTVQLRKQFPDAAQGPIEIAVADYRRNQLALTHGRDEIKKLLDETSRLPTT